MSHNTIIIIARPRPQPQSADALASAARIVVAWAGHSQRDLWEEFARLRDLIKSTSRSLARPRGITRRRLTHRHTKPSDSSGERVCSIFVYLLVVCLGATAARRPARPRWPSFLHANRPTGER